MRIHRMMRTVSVCSLITLGVAGLSTATSGAAVGGGRVAYSSLVSPSTTGNLPSVGAEAYAFNELGNEVTTSTNGRAVTTATLELSSWARQSGSWYGGDCASAPGSTFNHALTLNFYNAPGANSSAPGSLIASVTQTFAIPYRPSTDLSCGQDPNYNDAYTQWYDAATGTCYHGLLASVTFRFAGIKLPSTFVYGVAYDTSHFGPSPVGSAPCEATTQGCPYDSLNIALSQDPTNVTVGSDPLPGTVFQNSPNGSEYCDGGAAGTGTFRLDSPSVPSCWGANAPYTTSPYLAPAIQFMTGA